MTELPVIHDQLSQQPSKGGSYVRAADGTLTRIEVPEAEPAPAPAAQPEPTPRRTTPKGGL